MPFSIQNVKKKLCHEPILKYPDRSKPYTLFTDVSNYRWAGGLTQEHNQLIAKETVYNVTPSGIHQWTVQRQPNKLGSTHKRGVCNIHVCKVINILHLRNKSDIMSCAVAPH